MATLNQLTQAKNNSLGMANTTSNGTNMVSAAQLLQAKNNALGTNLTANNPTVYASGQDLANAKNTYGSNYNYQNLATNPTANLKAGDIVAGGSAVTPSISDSMIQNAGAQRLYGSDAAGTLSTMQTNAKTALPQSYQNINSNIYAGTNYDKLSLSDIASKYQDQLTNALSNASNYHYVQSNNVGMDNTPYTNSINSATSNANSQATNYQSAVQKALDAYNGVSQNTSTGQSLRDQYNTKGATQFYADVKNDSNTNSQLNNYEQQYTNALATGADPSSIISAYNAYLDAKPTTTTTTNQNTSNTPESNADYIKNMTDKINSLYDAQRNNVGLYYQTGLDQAKQQYQQYRNQASVTDQQNLNKLKESMAQQGLFNSGDNITSQTGINNEYAGNLASYNQQEQNYYDTVNNQIAQQKASYDAQQAQAMMDLYNNADSRSFKLANLSDSEKQQAFQNAMTGINAQYGMGQDQFGNTLKGTTTTYGMGRDNVSDQMYNNDSQMKADQINYSRDQDYFNNNLKVIAQQYGMSEDQVHDLLNYAQFNASQDQRQFDNGMKANEANYGIFNDQVKNDQAQQQITNQANEWQKNYDYTKSRDAVSDSHWQQQFDYQQKVDTLKNALAQSRASSGGSGRSGGRSSSGNGSSGDYSNTDYKNSNQQTLNSYANSDSYSLAQKLQALSGYANSEGVSAADKQYAEEQKQALLDGRWYQ